MPYNGGVIVSNPGGGSTTVPPASGGSPTTPPVPTNALANNPPNGNANLDINQFFVNRRNALTNAQTANEDYLRSQAAADQQDAAVFGDKSQDFARASLGKIGGFEGSYGIALQNSIADRTEKTIRGIKGAMDRAISAGRQDLYSKLADMELNQLQTQISLNNQATDDYFKTKGLDIQQGQFKLQQEQAIRDAANDAMDQVVSTDTNNANGEVTVTFRRKDGTLYSKSLGRIGQRTIFAGGSGSNLPLSQQIERQDPIFDNNTGSIIGYMNVYKDGHRQPTNITGTASANINFAAPGAGTQGGGIRLGNPATANPLASLLGGSFAGQSGQSSQSNQSISQPPQSYYEAITGKK